MKFRSTSRALASSLALTALALPAYAGWFSSGWEDSQEKVTECFKAVNADPAYAGILVKMPTNPTALDLADETVPTEAEAELLKERSRRREPCRVLDRQSVEKYHPYMTHATERFYFQSDLVLVELMKRRISWGNASKLFEEAWLTYSSEWDAYAKARSDEERRQLAKQFDDLNRSIQSIPVGPPAGRVTCRWNGSTLYCDPY